MTEQEWLASDDPQGMLNHLLHNYREEILPGPDLVIRCLRFASERKLRLFSVACCRQVWDELTDEWSQRAVIIAERNVEGMDDAERMPQMHLQAFRVPGSEIPGPLMAAAECCNPDAMHAARQASQLPTAKQAMKSALLRDICGNPWRPVTASNLIVSSYARWEVVRSIAQGIYADRAFDRMPILADALEDAGCANEEILNHCRGWDHPCPKCQNKEPFPHPECDSYGMQRPLHVRGCWVVDLLLGKE